MSSQQLTLRDLHECCDQHHPRAAAGIAREGRTSGRGSGCEKECDLARGNNRAALTSSCFQRPTVRLREPRTWCGPMRACGGSGVAGEWEVGHRPTDGQLTTGIYAAKITSLRTQLDAALNALLIPTTPYTDPQTLTVIKAVHFTDLQARIR